MSLVSAFGSDQCLRVGGVVSGCGVKACVRSGVRATATRVVGRHFYARCSPRYPPHHTVSLLCIPLSGLIALSVCISCATLAACHHQCFNLSSLNNTDPSFLFRQTITRLLSLSLSLCLTLSLSVSLSFSLSPPPIVLSRCVLTMNHQPFPYPCLWQVAVPEGADHTEHTDHWLCP
jgi:hypothetical protein